MIEDFHNAFIRRMGSVPSKQIVRTALVTGAYGDALNDGELAVSFVAGSAELELKNFRLHTHER